MRNRGLSIEDRAELAALQDEVVKLRVALKEAKVNLAETQALRKKEQELSDLEKQIVSLKIDKDRIEEGFAKERREIEHKVGLEQTRQSQELELGKREAVLAVGEGNLDKDKERFEEQMRFNTERFERESKATREILMAVLDTLPDVSEHVTLALGPGKERDNGEE